MTERQPQNAEIIRAGKGRQDAVPLGHEIYLSRDISNAYRILTTAGDVIVNTGIVFNAEENFRRESPISSNPINKILFTKAMTTISAVGSGSTRPRRRPSPRRILRTCVATGVLWGRR